MATTAISPLAAGASGHGMVPWAGFREPSLWPC